MGEVLVLLTTAPSPSFLFPPPNTFLKTTNAPASKLIWHCPPLLLPNARPRLLPAFGAIPRHFPGRATDLVENGSVDNFLLEVDGLPAASVASSDSRMLLSEAVLGFLRDGELPAVVEVLNRVEKLGVCPLSLFDASATEMLVKECCRLVDAGRVYEYVELVEILAGYGFSVKTFVEPSAILRICVEKCDPNMAVRYASILPHREIMFCSIIQEFGKKRDLKSALIAFNTIKVKLDTPNMYICRCMIDICGSCGDLLRSRAIFEELLAQNVTPNIYIFNSLMNVNAHDLSYTLHIYGHMQAMGITADVASYNVLLKACCLATRVDLAQDIYREMKQMESIGVLKLDVITYSTIIKAFNTMRDVGINPDVIAYTAAIKACIQNKNVKIAFSLFEEMKKYGLKPNAVTYNTLLKAHTKYGSLHEVQQCLAVYQDMRRAGYSPSDYFLKELLEEWCEGVIKDGEKGLLGHVSEKTDSCKPHGLLLKKLATILQRDTLKGSLIDLRGLTKIEARTAVLAFLRMIKERFMEGLPVEDDMIIITGLELQQLASANNEAEELRAVVIKVLRNELDLDVLAEPPVVANSDVDHAIIKRNGFSKYLKYTARRPPNLVRLLVPKKSLHHWLQKCVCPIK